MQDSLCAPPQGAATEPVAQMRPPCMITESCITILVKVKKKYEGITHVFPSAPGLVTRPGVPDRLLPPRAAARKKLSKAL